MHKKYLKHNAFTLILLALIVFQACDNSGTNTSEARETPADPLPSWNNGEAKNSIITFVTAAIDEKNENYIPVNERIVVFDNDGTLWSEQPYYFQLQFVLDRIELMASDHPEWSKEQPFKAAIARDVEMIKQNGLEGLLQLVKETHSGMSADEFDAIVREWIDTAKHPQSGMLFKEMVYQPMLEVLDYFRENDFKTYIVSGGGIAFMRPWTMDVYGIPPEQVVGSRVKTSFESIDGNVVLKRLPELDFINDKAGKPVGIYEHIGQRPVAAFGNSDGDLQMLQYTAAGMGPNLMVYIHHTDAEREYAYDRESHIGRLDKGLDEAREKEWLVVDMACDWKLVYPDMK